MRYYEFCANLYHRVNDYRSGFFCIPTSALELKLISHDKSMGLEHSRYKGNGVCGVLVLLGMMS